MNMTTDNVNAVKPYVGKKIGEQKNELFKSETTPTVSSHGDKYIYVMGPFRTVRAAKWYEQYGSNNPHALTVAACEKHAKKKS